MDYLSTEDLNDIIDRGALSNVSEDNDVDDVALERTGTPFSPLVRSPTIYNLQEEEEEEKEKNVELLLSVADIERDSKKDNGCMKLSIDIDSFDCLICYKCIYENIPKTSCGH